MYYHTIGFSFKNYVPFKASKQNFVSSVEFVFINNMKEY